MSPSQVVSDAQTKFKEAATHLNSNLGSLRTGRANASMLDTVTVEAYGTSMPLNQLANITAPEAQLIQITPFDPTNLQAIASAIRSNQSLGLNPSDDGHVVRVPVPQLTEERRRELAKQVGQKLEDYMVRIRAIRHEAIDAILEAKKNKVLGEDEAKRLNAQIEVGMNKSKVEAEAAAKAKETEIMTL